MSSWRRSGVFWALLPGAAVFGLDQLIKIGVNSQFVVLERKPILGQDLYVLARSLNAGLIFDWGSAVESHWLPWIKQGIPLLGMAILVALIFLMRKRITGWKRIGISVFIGGGVSNFFDQWINHYATDTFQIYYGNGLYLPHNLADIAITLGMVAWVAIWLAEFKGPSTSAEARI